MIASLRKRPGLCVFGAAVALLIFALAMESPVDLSRVHPRLSALKQPYRSVETSYYLDGGSIGVQITDADGQMVECVMPVSTNRNAPYPSVWLGTMKPGNSLTNGVPLSDPIESKKFLLKAVANSRPTTGDGVIAMIRARGWPKDYARALMFALRRNFWAPYFERKP